jgi:YD repeat-containing protein
MVSYTDVDGNVSSTAYDIDGHVKSRGDGKGTVTYTYDGSDEHRGLVTKVDTGMGSLPARSPACTTRTPCSCRRPTQTGWVATRAYDNNGTTRR